MGNSKSCVVYFESLKCCLLFT